MRKLFPTDFVPQPSWSSDEEEALVSFLLLYSTSYSWTFRRTDVSLGTNPSLVQYQKGLLASLVCWYCELAALLTARLTLLSSSITHRVSSLFQRDVCFVSERENGFTATCSFFTEYFMHVLRVCTYVTKNAM